MELPQVAERVVLAEDLHDRRDGCVRRSGGVRVRDLDLVLVVRLDQIFPARRRGELLLLQELGVVAETKRPGVDAHRLEARLLGLAARPVVQLVEVRRFVGHREILLGRGQMRVAGAAEPDVALGIRGLRGDLGERLARSLQGERDPSAGLALELVGDGLAPLGLDAAVYVERSLGERG